MWGCDEYSSFPVINQTDACLSQGWPPQTKDPGPPWRGLVGGSAQTSESASLPSFSLSHSFHPPSPDSYCADPFLPLVTGLSPSDDADNGPNSESVEV